MRFVMDNSVAMTWSFNDCSPEHKGTNVKVQGRG